MSDDARQCPARTVYDTLVAEPVLTADRYRELIAELRPVWIEEVVCPVHITVGHLCEAADAVAAGQDAAASHEAARAYLYRALSTARLLTLEERLQEVVVDDLLRGAQDHDVPQAGQGEGRSAHGWNAWRRDNGA